jgi:S1-C subfamily serine protease
MSMSKKSKVGVALAALFLVCLAIIAGALVEPDRTAWLARLAKQLWPLRTKSEWKTASAAPPAPVIGKSGSFDLVELAKKARSAVILIEVFDDEKKPIGSGSGFFVSDDGFLITNYHVIEKASSAVAKADNGGVFPIKGVVQFDRENDLVVLAVEGRDLPFLPLGNTSKVEAGDHIAVIGNPLGLEGSLSEGIVAAKREQAPGDHQWLQITAPISPGSSDEFTSTPDSRILSLQLYGMRWQGQL